MQPIRISEGPNSPEVNLDKERSRFEFYGKIFPEDPNEFFAPILFWFREYTQSPNRETMVIFKLDYINTVSSKKVIDLLHILNDIHKQKKVIVVTWYYRSEDEDMRDTGETFSEIVNIPFRLLPY